MRWNFDCWPGWQTGMGIGGMVMMLFFWALIIAGIFILFRWMQSKDRTDRPGYRETPLDILKKRYAGGEINKDEFDRMKKDLEA